MTSHRHGSSVSTWAEVLTYSAAVIVLTLILLIILTV